MLQPVKIGITTVFSVLVSTNLVGNTIVCLVIVCLVIMCLELNKMARDVVRNNKLIMLQPVRIGITTVFSVLVSTNLVGNMIVCLVIIIYRDMRAPVNFLLLNLAVADMMVAVFIALRLIMDPYQFKISVDGMTGTLICKVLSNFTWIGAAASIFTLVAIAFERYYAVVYPYVNKGKLTYEKLKVIVPVSWISSAILNIPLFLTIYFDKDANTCVELWHSEWLHKAYTLTWFFVGGIIPVLLMIVLYSRVVYALWFKREQDNLGNTRQGVKKVRKRVTKAVLTATIIYGLCWMTNLTFYVLGFNSPSPEYGYATYITSVALVTCNSTVNPIIYVFVSQKFREKIKSLLCCNKSNINRVESSSSGTMIYTVKPVSSGHPRGMVRRPPNTG